MIPATIQRIVWKEYRTFRGFWISIAVLTLLLQWFIVYVHLAMAPRTVYLLNPDVLPFTALAMAAFYALGVGATIFNLEHEQTTYEQLRAWPAGFQVVWLGKLLFALVSSIVLGLLLSVATRCIWGSFAWWLCVLALPLGVTVLSLAVLCSLWIRRPLLSTFVAGTATFGVWLVFQFLMYLATDDGRRDAPIVVEMIWLGPGGAAGSGSQLSVASRWFAERPHRRARAWSIPRANRWSRLRPRTAGVQLVRMAWLSIRQLGWIWLGTFIVVGLLLLLLLGFSTTEPLVEPLAIAVLCVWPSVIGATLFSGDQSGRSHQFFVERGISDGQLWWQRQAIGLLMFTVGIAGTLAAVMLYTNGLRTPTEEIAFLYASGSVFYCVLAYGTGQMASLFLRSPLLSLTASGVAIAPLMAWCVFAVWFRLPWWLAAAIPAMGLWTASRLREDLDARPRWPASLAGPGRNAAGHGRAAGRQLLPLSRLRDPLGGTGRRAGTGHAAAIARGGASRVADPEHAARAGRTYVPRPRRCFRRSR